MSVRQTPAYSVGKGGPVLIFNNKNYASYEGLPKRAFSDVDVAKLYQTFKALGYKDVRMKHDLTAKAMFADIKAVAESDHTHSDSVVVVFLAYGEQNVIYAKDRPVGLQLLLDPLKGDACHPSLVGKPKIVILQMCDPHLEVYENDADDVDTAKKVVHCIPSEADFIYLGSQAPGLLTGRPGTQGSAFIAALCRNLSRLSKERDLCGIMTRTSRDVGEEMDAWNAEWEAVNDELLPFMINQLTRQFYFSTFKCDTNK